VPDAASEKGEPNLQESLCQVDVKNITNTHIINVPGAVANNKFNTNSPEDGQTNYKASTTETKRIAMTASTSEERGTGGITKCAPTSVLGNFATLDKIQLRPASANAAHSFDK
jgi:hypothetical protein